MLLHVLAGTELGISVAKLLSRQAVVGIPADFAIVLLIRFAKRQKILICKLRIGEPCAALTFVDGLPKRKQALNLTMGRESANSMVISSIQLHLPMMHPLVVSACI